MRINFKFILISLLFCYVNVYADSLSLNVDVNKEFNNFNFLLENPSSVVLIYRNINIDNLEKMNPTIIDLKSFSLDLNGPLNKIVKIPIRVTYLNRKDTIYYYDIFLDSPLFNSNLNLSIDIKNIDENKLILNIDTINDRLISNDLKNKIQTKINSLFSIDIQNKILVYLKKDNTINLEKIIVDSINIKPLFLDKFDRNSDDKHRVIKFITLLIFILFLNIVVLSLNININSGFLKNYMKKLRLIFKK